MLVLITFGIVLLSVRTIFIPEVPVRNVTGHVIGCTLNAGTYINIGGRILVFAMFFKENLILFSSERKSMISLCLTESS